MNQFTAKEPDEIVFKLTLEMKLGDWKRLKKQLRNGAEGWYFPANTIRGHIDDMVTQAEKTYWIKPD